MKFPEKYITHKAVELAIDRGAFWDQKAADKILKFATKVFKPQFIEGNFEPLEWQSRWLQTLYGAKDKDGNRLWKYSILHCPKKCGKTLLCSLVSCYELLCPSDPSPQVFTGSVSSKNAQQIFDEIVHTFRATGLSSKKFCRITPHQHKLQVYGTNARYSALASDGDRVQGFNSSMTCLDESGYHKNSSLWDSLRYAHIARKNGVCILISTASDNQTGYYHSLYLKAKRLLSGEDLDATWMPTLFEMSSPEADPEDPAEWYRAVPSLGTSYSEEAFRNDLKSAQQDPAEFLRFKRYRLNVWCSASDNAYYCVGTWDKHTTEEPDLTNAECTIGNDLSLTTDPSSTAAIFKLEDGTIYVKSWSWVAREGIKLREKSSLPMMQNFADGDCLTITEGDMIDHELILQHNIDLCAKYNVRKVIFDPTSAVVMMNRLAEATGVDVRRMPTSFRYMSAPMKAFRLAIQAGKIKHDGNNFFRYALANVRVQENREGDIRPSVSRSTDHIDPVIAALCAYSDLCEEPTKQYTEIIWDE